MTVQDFLDRATATLTQAGIASARLDTLILLEDALGKDRAELLAHPDTEISSVTEVGLNTKITQRASHIPLAYIRGKAEFYGREFFVNEHVLVPRPETETMIDLLKRLDFQSQDGDATIADIGTGSGAIAITVKLEFPDTTVVATDIDSLALEVARQNAAKLAADADLLPGNLLEPIKAKSPSDTPTILLANLPYVPEGYEINRAAEHEPKHAIFSGKDGLSLYRQLWEQIAALPAPPEFILTEALPSQHAVLAELAKAAGFTLHNTQNLIQVFGQPS